MIESQLAGLPIPALIKALQSGKVSPVLQAKIRILLLAAKKRAILRGMLTKDKRKVALTHAHSIVRCTGMAFGDAQRIAWDHVNSFLGR